MKSTIEILNLPLSFELFERKEEIPQSAISKKFVVIIEIYSNVTALEDFGHTIKKGDVFKKLIIYPQARMFIAGETSKITDCWYSNVGKDVIQNYDINGYSIDKSDSIIEIDSFKDLDWAVDTFAWLYSPYPKKGDKYNQEAYQQKFRIANKWLLECGAGSCGDFEGTLLEGEDIKYDFSKRFKPEYATPGINLWKKGEYKIFMYVDYFTDCVLD